MPKDGAAKDGAAKEAAKKEEAVPVVYKCLRCGASWEETYNPADGPIELTCKKCKSNSVRRLKKQA